MKKIILLGILFITFAGFDAWSQTNGSTSQHGSSANNTTNASTVGSSTTSDPAAIGNDRTGQGQSRGTKAKGSGTRSSATVDGSNGSATNDGASGQSGSPAPLPSMSTNSGSAKRTSDQKSQRSTRKMSRTPNSSDEKRSKE